MDIKYFGHASFQLRGKSGKVITDPYDPKMMGKKFPKCEADIVTVSHQHEDHNASHLVGEDPLIIDIPGEYEKNSIRIYGFDTYHDKSQGAERGKNTIFKIEIDGLSVVHCGDLGHVLKIETIEMIDEVDVLLIPVGGFYTINADEASEVVSKLEPSVVIPMHYKTKGFNQELMSKLAPVSEFIQKIGVTDVEPVKKYSLRKKNLGEEMNVVVMDIS